MILVGCDFHSRYQQIASVDTETGDLVERRLEHQNREAHAFYRPDIMGSRAPVPFVGYKIRTSLRIATSCLNRTGRARE
jgi:hypothetical protein